jgi:hypothetical protein
MLPLHTTSPAGEPAAPAPDSRIRLLLLTAAVLGIAAAVLGDAPGVLAFVLAVGALGAASALALRDRWTALQPDDAGLLTGSAPELPAWTPAQADSPYDTALTADLRRLYADHVEQLNLALAEGREDLARELSDAYPDRALALLTDAGLPPARSALHTR